MGDSMNGISGMGGGSGSPMGDRTIDTRPMMDGKQLSSGYDWKGNLSKMGSALQQNQGSGDLLEAGQAPSVPRAPMMQIQGGGNDDALTKLIQLLSQKR